ncbi:hypothetical protein Plec18167_004995 [Paecilomyces lecythidis]|uniref:Uncharacterized protein n=1 Tax=Paecilomyces lecythidis TaxID=3004212 RepID=A0ABR3XNJ4_9EURO
MIRTLITALLPSMAKSPLITCSISLSVLVHLAALPLISTTANDETYFRRCSSGCGSDLMHQTTSPFREPGLYPDMGDLSVPSLSEMNNDLRKQVRGRRQELEDQILFELRSLGEAAKLWGLVKMTLKNMEHVRKVVEFRPLPNGMTDLE